MKPAICPICNGVGKTRVKEEILPCHGCEEYGSHGWIEVHEDDTEIKPETDIYKSYSIE